MILSFLLMLMTIIPLAAMSGDVMRGNTQDSPHGVRKLMDEIEPQHVQTLYSAITTVECANGQREQALKTLRDLGSNSITYREIIAALYPDEQKGKTQTPPLLDPAVALRVRKMLYAPPGENEHTTDRARTLRACVKFIEEAPQEDKEVSLTRARRNSVTDEEVIILLFSDDSKISLQARHLLIGMLTTSYSPQTPHRKKNEKKSSIALTFFATSLFAGFEGVNDALQTYERMIHQETAHIFHHLESALDPKGSKKNAILDELAKGSATFQEVRGLLFESNHKKFLVEGFDEETQRRLLGMIIQQPHGSATESDPVRSAGFCMKKRSQDHSIMVRDIAMQVHRTSDEVTKSKDRNRALTRRRSITDTRILTMLFAENSGVSPEAQSMLLELISLAQNKYSNEQGSSK